MDLPSPIGMPHMWDAPGVVGNAGRPEWTNGRINSDLANPQQFQDFGGPFGQQLYYARLEELGLQAMAAASQVHLISGQCATSRGQTTRHARVAAQAEAQNVSPIITIL